MSNSFVVHLWFLSNSTFPELISEYDNDSIVACWPLSITKDISAIDGIFIGLWIWVDLQSPLSHPSGGSGYCNGPSFPSIVDISIKINTYIFFVFYILINLLI